MDKVIATPLKRKLLFYFNCLIFLALTGFVCFSNIQRQFNKDNFTINDINEIIDSINASDYIIYNSKCRLPNVDPFNKEVSHFFKKESYIPCSKNDLLTYVTKNPENTIATLHIAEKLIKSYDKGGITCCYSNVTRFKSEHNKDPDNHISLSNCVDFQKNITIAKPVIVRCRNTKTKKEVYSNVHVAVTIPTEIKEKIAKFDKSKRPLSLLYVGIDSISRLNMMRVLPQTRDYLNDNDWTEMQAYNKMGDNTFPNLMAILTGRNITSAYETCAPTVEAKLDHCNFIWYDYEKMGYITGYGEDQASISSFNYHKKGFFQEPVDYYFRSYVIAAEKLKIVTVDEMAYCTGPETSGERILNLAKDFATTFKDVPNFGFFWMNSFSHNKLNSATRMDEKVKDFLVNITEAGILENSVVVFISDHGLRFGKILQTHTGWLEERLPMFYMWVPKWFREEHPLEYENLRTNQNKLTNPYDLHMTLQDFLEYSVDNFTVKQSEGCPKCKSLFKEIDSERSCEDASIDLHWCACGGFEKIDEKNVTVLEATKFILTELEKRINKRKEANKCAKYKINKVISASISRYTENWYKNDTYLLIVFETSPEAIFEATVKLTRKTILASISFTLMEGISRLDAYKMHSKCINDTYLKTLCYCNK